ncbi:hypothetical protein TWF225_010098 [Orbilia oligospora]|uniref:Uncharacterized protein n=1 Tax=Orbilia oligospora TaxID=2813651 RepID=A0A7C8PT39_ORBOL|nr:hypothetical protein TWF751_001505 [Orbilia oligospora]KAF3193338.1 hypothetical protein TWF225_010098 [Orbilia oligospora]KAF3241321.1 hypothetical protein TWF128_011036 [Orbilia oligospora]KAF3249279.1 hypothetical protein TWF217_008879 [Orbilia oligospora]KAF3296354.1 hypothetical protein TWF132_010951 [Orbilia oligospora]
MKWYNNPIVNPFYRDERDEAPEVIAKPTRIDEKSSPTTKEGNVQTAVAQDPEKGSAPQFISESVEDLNNSDFQFGIKKVEAIATIWSKKELYLLYAWIWLMYCILSLQSQSSFSLFPYAYSSFNSHSLISTSAVVASIVGGVLRLPIGKVIDIWGRAEGFVIFAVIFLIGLVMLAATDGVATYAAAYVFNQVGFTGISYIMAVFVADTTRLRNRGLMFAYTSSPYIMTTFLAPRLAQAWLDHSTWRWGFGVFCIILPVVFAPFVALLFVKQNQAMKTGLLRKEKSGRTLVQSLKHYAIEFDAVGMLILMAGFVLFLLPFNLAGSLPESWKRSDIISMIVVGFVLLVFFPIYERYWAPKSFIPWRLLRDRTIFGGCLTIGSLFFGFYCWDLYFSSFLQVVFNLDVTQAGYVGNIYSIGSTFWAIVVGYLIRRTNRYKWIGVLFVPVHILGAGLMIHFRQPWQSIGFVIMCQIFIAFAGGSLVICHEIAGLAVGTHADIAMILALLYLAAAIGGAMGSSVSGAIWQNTFPELLFKALPAELKGEVANIVYSLPTQLSYPPGSPGRDAIVYAYGVAQQRMCIAATAMASVTLVGVWMWRDIRLDNKKQVKGTVL